MREVSKLSRRKTQQHSISVAQILFIFSAFAIGSALPFAAASRETHIRESGNRLVEILGSQSGHKRSCSFRSSGSVLRITMRSGAISNTVVWAAPKKGNLNWFGELSVASAGLNPLRWSTKAFARSAGKDVAVSSASWSVKSGNGEMPISLLNGSQIDLRVKCAGAALIIGLKGTGPPIQLLRVPTIDTSGDQ